MKTTVALTRYSRAVVEPTTEGRVIVTFQERGPDDLWQNETSEFFTQDQIGALIFGLERAAEAAEIAQDRASLTA